MKQTLPIAFMTVLALLTGTIFAATVPTTNPGGMEPPCKIGTLTPAYTKSLSANVLGTNAIVASTSYYDWPCYGAVVDFLIAPLSPVPPPHPYEDLFFDSMGNELVDSKDKCETYHQSTAVYLLQSNGYVLKDRGVLVGTWSVNKCHFHPPKGKKDFRGTPYSPSSKEEHWRVVSTVTTGKGVVRTPGYHTYAKNEPFATPGQVCFAVEHKHSDNTSVVGCADPTP